MKQIALRLTRTLLSPFVIGFRRAVLIWIPSYDSSSHPLVRWLDGLRIPFGATRRIEIGSHVDLNLVARNLNETTGLQRVVIFLGHGTKDALLGLPREEPTDILFEGSQYSVIYDESMIDGNQTALFAFCCYAGAGLGETIGSQDGCSFLGFTEEIVLSVRDKYCRDVWRNIVRKVSSEIIQDGVILPKHEQLLGSLYDGYADYFLSVEGRQKTEDAFLMALYLNWQGETLCRYPRTAD